VHRQQRLILTVVCTTCEKLQKKFLKVFQILLKKETKFTILRLTAVNLDKIYSFLLFCDFFDFDSSKCTYGKSKKISGTVTQWYGSADPDP
jgi:hypothetical protein